MNKLIIIFFLIIFGTLVYKNSHFAETSVDDIINYKQEAADLAFKQHITKIHDLDKDISLEQVGCFGNLYNKFFLRKINPFNTRKDFDSGLSISQNTLNEDYLRILDIVTNNGFGDFAKKFKSKYSNNYSKVPLQQIAALALFSGYSYISISKFDENTIEEIYFTYSPPMDRHNITGNFSESEMKKYLSSSDISMNECGFTCGDGSKYYCGSTNHPNVKSPAKYAVYRIIEKV